MASVLVSTRVDPKHPGRVDISREIHVTETFVRAAFVRIVAHGEPSWTGSQGDTERRIRARGAVGAFLIGEDAYSIRALGLRWESAEVTIEACYIEIARFRADEPICSTPSDSAAVRPWSQNANRFGQRTRARGCLRKR